MLIRHTSDPDSRNRFFFFVSGAQIGKLSSIPTDNLVTQWIYIYAVMIYDSDRYCSLAFLSRSIYLQLVRA